MHCTDPQTHRGGRRLSFVTALQFASLAAALTLELTLAGCANKPAPAPATPAGPPPAPLSAPAVQAPPPPPVVVEPSGVPGKPGVRYVKLGPPVAPRNSGELQQQFARRLVAAHPDTSYMSASPPRLWAIPVIEVELNGDGSVRNISVLRQPSTGTEATDLAIAAIRRAAPYGDVSRLPKPWKIVETFLFDDDLRFKPRTLDVR